MMAIELFTKIALSPALSLLPPKMDSLQARAMIIAICLQESRLEHRKQVGGPARGFAQFEQGGVRGVIAHPATAEIIRNVCRKLVVPLVPFECYEAVTYNDILACCFTRLLLWTLPGPLAEKEEAQKGWEQYLSAWRPGKPRRESWDAYFNTAWLSLQNDEVKEA